MADVLVTSVTAEGTGEAAVPVLTFYGDTYAGKDTFTDDFERTELGVNWTGRGGTPQIVAGCFAGGSAGMNAAVYTAVVFGNDQASKGTIAQLEPGTEIGVTIRDGVRGLLGGLTLEKPAPEGIESL